MERDPFENKIQMWMSTADYHTVAKIAFLPGSTFQWTCSRSFFFHSRLMNEARWARDRSRASLRCSRSNSSKLTCRRSCWRCFGCSSHATTNALDLNYYCLHYYYHAKNRLLFLFNRLHWDFVQAWLKDFHFWRQKTVCFSSVWIGHHNFW